MWVFLLVLFSPFIAVAIIVSIKMFLEMGEEA